MTLTFSEYNHHKCIAINISDLVDRWSVIIEYKDDKTSEGECHYVNAIVRKDFYDKSVQYPISIIFNTFHDTLYDQSWYIDMIRGLFTSGLFAYYIDKDTFLHSGITEGQDPASSKW